jgi:hypothetical protein
MALMSLGYARVDKAPTFKTDPYPFVENLGQLADPEGRPLRDAYFSFEAPGMRGYVTRWGLTLYFYRAEGEGEERKEGILWRRGWRRGSLMVGRWRGSGWI